MTTRKRVQPDLERLDRVVADARRAREEREQSYRGRALKLYPWICGRCAREFDHSNVHELTVHHKDHNHDNNPPDGSNWELLCLYCHDNEHQKYSQLVIGEGAGFGVTGKGASAKSTTHNPFANLKDILDKKK